MRNAERGPDDHIALRVAEVYAEALNRLSDPRPTQRIGALHTLEVLAHDSPLHRQAVVDVYCAVLRAADDEDPAVRGTAQRTLARHLHPSAGPAYWAGVSVDLTGAVLSDLDLTGCVLQGSLTLDYAQLRGQTKLRGLVVRGPLSMRGITFFDHAWLERTVFDGPVRADGAVFRADAWIGETTVSGPASFLGAEFGGHAWFGNATFRGRLDLGNAVFRRSAGFRGAVFHGGVGLAHTTFLGPARVSMRDDVWNIAAPGWRVVIDPDNGSVGQLLWVGYGALIEPTPV